MARYHHQRLPKPSELGRVHVGQCPQLPPRPAGVRDGARLNAGTRPATREFADAERQLELYVDAGFTASEAFSIAIGVTRYVVGFVLEEQGERDRDDTEAAWSGGDPLAEVAPFPILSEALKPLLRVGTINTEAVFEAALGYMLAGMRESLAGRPKRKTPAAKKSSAAGKAEKPARS